MYFYKNSCKFVNDIRKINRTYKFRLYPNKEQTELLAKHFGCTRFVYNYFLNQRKEQYRLTGKSDNYYKQAKELTTLKTQTETEWLKEVNSQTLQFAVRCLEVAYTNFFQKRAFKVAVELARPIMEKDRSRGDSSYARNRYR